MKILQMATYDVERPDHGGKLRSHHMRKALKSRFMVETLSFEWSDHEDAATLQVLLDQSMWGDLGLNGLVIDWGICTYLDHRDDLYYAISKKVKAYSPDVLLMEQPFLWPLAQRFLQDGTIDPGAKIIYNSQNIEVGMKRKIYFDAFPQETAEKYTQYVNALETGIIHHAHGALAVSECDANYISEHTNIPIRVFANGHTRPKHNDQDDKWSRFFADYRVNWVFVGSWHPPNINGLRDLLAAMPVTVDSNQFALWILGSAGNGLLSLEGFRREDYPYLKVLGPVSGEDIDAAIMNSSGVVLPIWEGGGSNLKTAQALLSCKCIVGADFSFRGFESFVNEDGVFLGETPAEVSRLICESNPANSYKRSEAVASLEWDYVTKELAAYLAEIVI